jgi:hypothetical protein
VTIVVADRLVHGFGETAELADVEIDPAHIVLVGLLRHQDDFRLDDAGIADHAAARLDDGFRDAVAEMLAQRVEDRGHRPVRRARPSGSGSGSRRPC